MTEPAGGGLVHELLATVAAAVDTERLETALRERFIDAEEASPIQNEVLGKLVLGDILDESILAATPEDSSFPLRVLFGAIGEHLAEDDAFTLASGLNYYFRAEMDEEAKVHLGLSVSRLYYGFAAERLEADSSLTVSPLLAQLMSTELSRLRFDAVDHDKVFDSSVHERSPEADGTSSALKTPNTFACRVSSNEMVRFKAIVTT